MPEKLQMAGEKEKEKSDFLSSSAAKNCKYP